MNTRRPRGRASTIRMVAALLFSAMVVAACGGASGDGGSGSGAAKGLRVGYHTDVSSLDPMRGNAGSDHVVLYTIYDTLVSYSPDQIEPQPGLAESWEQPDPKTLVLTLREGVEFHDGEPFNAEAVKFNLERSMSEESNIQADVESVDSVEVVDDHTVRITLKHADAGLLLALADRAGMMVSPAAAQEHGGDLSANPVGTGPWQLEEWRRGASISLTRFDGYWSNPEENAQTLRFNVLSDVKTRINALRSGEVDLISRTPPTQLASLEGNDGIRVKMAPRLYTYIIYLNNSYEHFRDPRVRKAINLAIDRETLVEAGLAGKGEPAHTPLPQQHWAAPESGAIAYEHDIDGAKRLLAEAGYPDGFSFALIAYPDAFNTRRAELVKSQLAEVGIQVNIQQLELTRASDAYFNDQEHPALLSAWTGRPAPLQTFRLMFTEDGYYNAGHVATPELEDRLSEASETVDQDQRAQLLRSAAAIVHEESLYVPLSFPSGIYVMDTAVQGFQSNLLGKFKLTGVTVSH